MIWTYADEILPCVSCFVGPETSLTNVLLVVIAISAFYIWRLTIWAEQAGGYWPLLTGSGSSPASSSAAAAATSSAAAAAAYAASNVAGVSLLPLSLLI